MYTKKELHDKKVMKRIAKDLQEFLDIVEMYCIYDDMPEKTYADSIKTIKKLIKHLQNGEADKVYAPNLDKVLNDIDQDYPF